MTKVSKVGLVNVLTLKLDLSAQSNIPHIWSANKKKSHDIQKWIMCTPKNNINFISIFLKKQTTNNSLTMLQQITFFLNPHPLKSLTLCSASIPVLPFYFGPPLCLPLISCGWTLHSVLPFCLIPVRFILFPALLSPPNTTVLALNENFSAEIMATEPFMPQRLFPFVYLGTTSKPITQHFTLNCLVHRGVLHALS